MGLAAVTTLLLPGSSLSNTTINFDDLAPNTAVTNQYADVGGPGQGVVFGPLPGGAGDSARPVVQAVPAGQAQSGAQVANISCPGCEFYPPHTTATFAVPRSRVSMYVGYLGAPAICPAANPNNACAFVTLLAFDSAGNQIAASAPARVVQGTGVHTQVSVSTPSNTIAGFEVMARDPNDIEKQIAIDNLSFDTPSTPPPPDFTLTPAATAITVVQGQSATDAIGIGRLSGSAGNIALSASGLPAGVHAQFLPNPAGGTATTLTVSADTNAPLTTGATVTITGTPQSSRTGTTAHSFTLSVRVAVGSGCAHVSTAQQLIDALTAGYRCIFVENYAQIDLAQVPDNPASTGSAVLHIPDGVMLESGRSPTVQGGLLYMSHRVSKDFMLELGSNTRVTGLRLRGYNPFDTNIANRMDGTIGVAIHGVADVLIDNNEIYDWPKAAVDVNSTPNFVVDFPSDFRSLAARIQISGNFIHNDVECGVGYGVAVGGTGFALIDRNVFNFNRHDVSGDGHPYTGYIAELNFSLTSGPKCDGKYNQHFDMHGSNGGYGGTAGEFIDIRRNTIRGDQSYGFLGALIRPAFELRGTPVVRAIFEENAVAHGHSFTAVAVRRVSRSRLQNEGKLIIRNNRYNINTATELAVGDFNSDGQADVFQATGAGWWYSPSGRREWRFLNDSSLRLDALAFGDFNGDGKTDVFSQNGDQWRVSYGGASPWQALPTGSNIPMKYYRFGDFNGDGKTDIFRTGNGGQWWYSDNGATAWKPLQSSSLKIDELRFGDFDGDGKTDVFGLANHQWSVSYGGVSPWRRLNKELSSNLGELVFADFDGDGHTDIARSHNGRWEVSWNGRTPWKVLRAHAPEQLSTMLLGHFNGDKRADALQFRGGSSSPIRIFRLSMGGVGPLVRWSLQDMP
jgi:hypothetical protein